MVAGLWVGQTKPPARWGSARALGRPLGPHLACRWFGFRSRFFFFRSLFVLVAALAQPSFGSNTFWLKPPIFQGAPRGGILPPSMGPRGEGGVVGVGGVGDARVGASSWPLLGNRTYG